MNGLNVPIRRRSRSDAQVARRRGFTLIEMIATIVILAAIGTVASNILLTASDGYLNACAGSQLTSELSMAMDRIVREFRQIDLDDDAAADIGPDINNLTPASITWHTNYSLTWTGSTLELVENGGAAETMLTDVKGFSITAYDEDNSALAATITGDNCDDIRRLSVTITMQRYGVQSKLRSKVFIRSTMARGAKDPS